MFKIRQNGENLLPPFNEVVWAYDERADIICLAVRIPTRAISHNSENTFFWGVQKSYAYADFNNIACDVEIQDFTPTHWAPLPKLPSKKRISKKGLLEKAKSLIERNPERSSSDLQAECYSHEDLKGIVCSVVEDIFINEVSLLRNKSPRP